MMNNIIHSSSLYTEEPRQFACAQVSLKSSVCEFENVSAENAAYFLCERKQDPLKVRERERTREKEGKAMKDQEQANGFAREPSWRTVSIGSKDVRPDLDVCYASGTSFTTATFPLIS